MKFKVGDRVRIVPFGGFKWRFHKVGDLGVVVGVKAYVGPILGQAYILDITPAGHYICEGAMELVPPDKEQTVKWHECAWSPRALPVFAPSDNKVTT